MDNDDDVNWNETRQVSPAIESIESLTEISSIVSEPPEIRQMPPVKPIRQDLNATIDGMAHLASTKEPKPVKRGGFLRKVWNKPDTLLKCHYWSFFRAHVTSGAYLRRKVTRKISSCLIAENWEYKLFNLSRLYFATLFAETRMSVTCLVTRFTRDNNCNGFHMSISFTAIRYMSILSFFSSSSEHSAVWECLSELAVCVYVCVHFDNACISLSCNSISFACVAFSRSINPNRSSACCFLSWAVSFLYLARLIKSGTILWQENQHAPVGLLDFAYHRRL